MRVGQAMRQFERIDRELFRKYSGPGPRYTSYPTAPVFSPTFGPDAYMAEIRRTNETSNAGPLSLYAHLPFCDTLCYFCGCTMLVTHSRSQISDYNSYLMREIDTIGSKVSPDRRVVQMHWGGGSPSYLSPEEIREVGEAFRRRFTYAEDIEAGVEIDPRGLTFEHLQAFREAGFNRVSLGVQDYNETVQVAVNRVQSERITADTVEWSRKLGFASINVDLIYGLPHQTIDSFVETVRRVLRLDPDRLAVFHVNDSKKGLGSRVDRHEHIGKGAIGLDGFRHLMNDPRFAGIPKLLETPKSDDLHEDMENLATLRGLIRPSSRPHSPSRSRKVRSR